MNRLKLALIALGFILLSIIELEAKDTNKLSTSDCEITFGWDVVKPYQYWNNGKVVGFQIELVQAITDEMGCKLVLENGVWHELLSKVESGDIDFIADMTITEERMKFGLFSETYRLESYTLYVRAEDFEKYRNLSFEAMLAKGFRLGLTKGFIYNQEIETARINKAYNSQFRLMDNNAENYERLVSKEIDGFLEDSMVAGYTLREKEIGNLVKGMPIEFYTGDISFLFSKKTVSPDLVNRFNHAMEKVKKSPLYEKAWIKQLYKREN